MRTGVVVSTTVTIWVQVLLLRQPSVARQVRVALKVFPQSAFVMVPTMLMEFVPQVSVAVGASNVQALPHSAVLFVEHVIVGGTVSLKVIVCTQLAALPQPSVAVQVRRIVPLRVQLVPPKVSRKVMLVTPLQVSVAVATPVMLVVAATVHSRVMLVGQVITGGTVSLKLIVCTQLAALPQPSIAVQVRRIVPLPVQLVLPKASRKVMLV